MDPKRQKRLSEVAALAVEAQATYGTPAEMTVTQWALESEWGAKPAGHANYFGIKRAGRHKLFCTVETHEFIGGKEITEPLEFADYSSIRESVMDYAWLISHGLPYAKAWTLYQHTGNLQALIFDVAKIYATAPSYWQLAQEISGQANVRDAIAAARSAQKRAA